jgi:hypothetical protein
MYAVVSTWYGSVGELDTLAPRFRTIIDQVCSRPGFQGAELLIDRTAGKALAKCLWDSKEAMGASSCCEIFGRDLYVGSSEPTVERFEVLVAASSVTIAA